MNDGHVGRGPSASVIYVQELQSQIDLRYPAAVEALPIAQTIEVPDFRLYDNERIEKFALLIQPEETERAPGELAGDIVSFFILLESARMLGAGGNIVARGEGKVTRYVLAGYPAPQVFPLILPHQVAPEDKPHVGKLRARFQFAVKD